MPAYYFAPFNTVYQNTYDEARDKGDALSALFHTEFGPWTFRFATRSVWHADLTQEDTDNNASVFVPKASYATPSSTISSGSTTTSSTATAGIHSTRIHSENSARTNSRTR